MSRALLICGICVITGSLALVPHRAAAQASGDPASEGAVESDEIEPGSATYESLERRGFFRRRAKGFGWFVTYVDPVFAQRQRLSDVLRAAPGIDVVGAGGEARAFTRGRVCPLAVIVDGAFTSIRNVDELVAEDLAAIEVYRSAAELPIEFHPPRFDRTCGALLVWSRIELTD